MPSHKFLNKLYLLLLLAPVNIFFAQPLFAQQTAQTLYSQYESAVYRIEVVTPGTENKASIGTGFVVARGNVLASNFHVVSSVVNEPDRYKLEWESVDGRRGPLTVIAVDVAHDISLLQAEEYMGEVLTTTTLPEKGSPLFSMGHPLALELAIVNGTANGLLENSLYEKIHFSGNINPGMSGGPTLDANGQVVGINVATSGDAVGYLVPASYLDALLLNAQRSNFEPVTDLKASIGQQLLSNQQGIIDEMLAQSWPNVQVGDFSVPGQAFNKLDCWSNNQLEDDDVKVTIISSVCRGQDSIFLSDRLRAGAISYEFFWLESESLSSRSFYWMYNARNRSAFFTGAQEDDVGNFTCSTEFVDISEQTFKANICARPYLEYPELTDFMVLVSMVGHEQQGLIFTLDLSTVTLNNGMAVLARFLEQFVWNP